MDYEKLTLKLYGIVKKILKRSPRCHDWEHTERVINNAKLIAEKEDCDLLVVELGALLHDIARADEISIKGKLCHARQGAKIVDDILKKEHIDKNLRIQIVRCVRRHRFRSSQKPESIEEKIVYDADKLDSLGAVGIGRSFLFAGRIGAKVHNKMEVALHSKTYTENDTAYREYLVKQRLLPSKMLTRAGRKIAKKRLAFMKKFFEEINSEVYG
ncbi:MAG TPA: HD domain-containing protein [Victivallales bacterium]|nr:HD domain-containing protein [Victivallales bacterium]